MKTTLTCIFLFAIIINCFALAVGDYMVRPTVTTGNWNGTAVWSICTRATNPVTWADTGTPPSNANGVITIASTQTITIGSMGGINVNADQLVVQGGLIIETNYTLSILNGTGTDLNVSGTITVIGTVNVESGATMNVSGIIRLNGGYYPGYVNGDGVFTLASGATLNTENSNGIASSGSTGSIQTGTRTFNNNAIYRYTASDGNQQTGTGLPSTVNKLTVENKYGIILTNAVTVTSKLTFPPMGTYITDPALYIQNGDLTMGASAIVEGFSSFGFQGTGHLINLEYCDYLQLFVVVPHAIPAKIDELMLQQNSIIPNDFEVRNINFNALYFDLNDKKVTLTNTDAALKGDSNISMLKIVKSETANTFSDQTSIERTWTTYCSLTDPVELHLSYPEALTDAASVNVWKRLTNSIDPWWLPVGQLPTSGTDPRTVVIPGVSDLGTFYEKLDWTISTTDQTLPVELSSFTGIATPQNYVRLQWTTQSETNVSGYYVFRSLSNELSSAQRINAFVQATNTSQETDYSFIDREAAVGNTWYYWLQHIDMNNQFEFHGPINITLTDNDYEAPIIPLKTSFQKIYPNPFNSTATIGIGLAKSASVNLVIYNTKGEKVRSLYSGQKSAGSFRLNWDGTNDSGRKLPSGIYLIVMKTGNASFSQKLILAK